MNLVDRVALVVHRIRHRKQPHIRRTAEHVIQILRLNIRLEALPPRVDLADGLLQRLLERAPDGHDLADGLHRGADVAVDLGGELRQVPLRDLGDDVVEGGLEAGGGGLGDGVRELGEGVAEGDLRGGVGEGVTRCLGRESAGPTQTAGSVSASSEMIENWVYAYRALTSITQYSLDEGCSAYWMLHSPTTPR